MLCENRHDRACARLRRAREIDYTQITDPTAQRERVHTTEMTDTCPPPAPDKPMTSRPKCAASPACQRRGQCAHCVQFACNSQRSVAHCCSSCMLHHQRHRAAPIGSLHTYSWPSAGVNLACSALARYTRARTRVLFIRIRIRDFSAGPHPYDTPPFSLPLLSSRLQTLPP